MEGILAGAVAFVVVAGWATLRWGTRGRDPTYLDDASILAAGPPDGMTAATATVISGGPATTAFMAGLLDLASRDEIAFRDETPNTPGAHRVGIEIHGAPSDDTRIKLNRRRPIGEGEAWLLAAVKSYAASNMPGLSQDERATVAMGAMATLFGFAASSIAAGPAGMSPGRMGAGMGSGPVADPQALLVAALTHGTPGPLGDLMRRAMTDPTSILADPEPFLRQFESATGRTPSAAEIASMTTWLRRQQATLEKLKGEPTDVSQHGSYISADHAATFHPPLGFATLLENYARRMGWIAGLSLVSRWKWHALAVAEVIVAFFVAAGSPGQSLAWGTGLGIAAGGLATWFIAPYMASRTRQGAVMRAQLAAYRRTLKATFDASSTLDDAIAAAGMAWLETPDQALVWGIALGLRPEIQGLLRRTTNGMSGGTIARTAFLPRWFDQLTGASGGSAAGGAEATIAPSPTPLPAAPGAPAPLPAAAGGASMPEPSAPNETSAPASPVTDYADLFAGIERIGSTTRPRMASYPGSR